MAIRAHVVVYPGNGEKAIRDIKRQMQRGLVFQSMKTARHFEKPSETRVKREQETKKRIKRNNRIRRLQD